MEQQRDDTANPIGPLLLLAFPALLVGVGSSLVLLAVSYLADGLERLLWTVLPASLGVAGTAAGWILPMLTVVGVVVGLVVWLVPGHAGPDPATLGLVEKPMPVRVLPGMLVTVVLGLAGGVSLGPENPTIATNISLAYLIGTWLMPASAARTWIGLATAGTIGALFGTPVAAALVLSETPMGGTAGSEPLWNRLFAPLVAAGAGSFTTVLLSNPVLSISLPAYQGYALGDVVSAFVITAVGAGIGLSAVYAFSPVHALFHRIGNPLLMLTAGGLVLGALGAVGGYLTLFKGLNEIKELAASSAEYGVGALLVLVVVKLAALVVAAASGFRGGRIFPALFVGVALGFLAHALVPSVSPVLTVACGVLGILLAITRQGWLSLFMAATTVVDIGVLPILCVAVLPAWLLVTGRPEMIIERRGG
ncbi:ion channel protein [Saccharopolyspora phatthalungensis]|uniref:H+/Cl- antiporter ClcA n=1 Tax=Saccharopolyspora phatthalungensis TaxID=664693 RepID=A0A840QDV7_9PSEU|nr:ion channel protein [Saccharopolyspora phatthalungensis]MBB5156645.1 H+/Cl- antiporter ClcA [Saccharopolyspora phatthalungensis]